MHRHGAKLNLCSTEGCTNKAQKGGVCWRHGANRNTHNVYTAFGSEFEMTTATQTHPISALLEFPQEKDGKEVAVLLEWLQEEDWKGADDDDDVGALIYRERS